MWPRQKGIRIHSLIAAKLSITSIAIMLFLLNNYFPSNCICIPVSDFVEISATVLNIKVRLEAQWAAVSNMEERGNIGCTHQLQPQTFDAMINVLRDHQLMFESTHLLSSPLEPSAAIPGTKACR